MKKSMVTAGMVLAALVLHTSADVVWSEDFEGATVGATSGNNQTLAGTVIQTANTASSLVTNNIAAFTASTGNSILLSTGANGFSAIRPSTNPINFASFATNSDVVISFDIYIPSDLAVAVGDVQPRFKLNGAGGNGKTISTGAVLSAGEHSISYSLKVADFLDGTGGITSVNEHRTFIGIDQGGAAVSDYLFLDNLNMEIIAIPEPATLGLVTVFGGAVLFIRRRFLI